MTTSAALRIDMPLMPVLMPWMSRLRRRTLMPAPLMTMPLVPDTRTEAKTSLQSIEIDFVIVTAPKPPGSRQLISPAAAVLEMAPAKVLQGAVRLHGLASSPTPETHVRVACACAGPVRKADARSNTASERKNRT